MRTRFSNKNFDIVMIMDAILISLACVLVIMAFREVSGSPVRNARATANVLMAATDDFSKDKVLHSGSMDANGMIQFHTRLDEVSKRIGKLGIGASFKIYSDHPNFAGVSDGESEFRKNALATARNGEKSPSEEFVEEGGASFIRMAQPLRAFRDCSQCEVLGFSSYKKGDVIGIREITLPVGDASARTIKKLLYAFGLLASALMVYLGLIIPMFRHYRKEQADISVRADSFEKQASTDPLTGLHNRRYFEQALESYLSEFNSIGSQLGLLVLDLDHFKSVNDNHGHDAGDLLLKEISLRLKAITREHDVIARIGGEEFAVLTPYVTEERLLKVAERYREAIQELRVDIGNVILRPTVSIGVATNANGEQHGEDLFTAADRKLYEAKRNGRNRVAA
ncbi:MAG: diguanylate cyclase [Pseudomonadota bacterium]